MILNTTMSEEQMPGVQKAAILMVIMGDQVSAEILRQLDEDEVQKVSREVARITSVSPDQAEWSWKSFTR